MTAPKVSPFQVHIDIDIIERIRGRVVDAHWTSAPKDDQDWTYGTDAAWLKRLAVYWATRYDWDAAQTRLNRWPQFKVEIDGQDIHFYHVRSSSPRRRALVLTHGWPGSVVEFLACVERLAYPERFGGLPDEGFDLVIPSLPGYGFSGRPDRPIGPRAVARIWRTLMTDVLGYSSFGAQGGDWGAAVTSWLGIDHADVTRAIHLNMVPSWIFAPAPNSDPRESDYHARVAAMRLKEMGYFAVQSTKPQTLAFALSDSPIGFASWVCEKFRTWGDTHGDIESKFDLDSLITNLMLYLVTDSVGPALWMYRGRAQEAALGEPVPRVEVPTGIALFPAEIIPYPPREVADRAYFIVRWTPMRAGGHFAALEEPEAFSDEVRAYFSQVGL
ncbi:MAG: epoxide hydrolase [Burkholderiaceae bacterium]|nr:epoxide hydrolase [Burkholderiaceae bacterium]